MLKVFLSERWIFYVRLKFNKFDSLYIVIINYERFDFAYEQGQNTNVCKNWRKNLIYKKNHN
jgi:hypothetical protein